MWLPRRLYPQLAHVLCVLPKFIVHAPKRAIMPPDRVMIPMAPTFCFRRVFCTPAITAPTAVIWSVVFAVFASASRGWKVACWSAMAGELGVDVFSRALQNGDEVGSDGLARM